MPLSTDNTAHAMTVLPFYIAVQSSGGITSHGHEAVRAGALAFLLE